MARITFITRDGCHLCDTAREVVLRVAEEVGVDVEEIDIDGDPSLLEDYAELVPVTLVDGRRHDYWRVDEGRLRKALTRRRLFG